MTDPDFSSRPDFNQRLFIGKTGEFLFERVMAGEGFRVLPYGYENVLRGVIGDIKFDKSDDALAVRSSPDFLVLRVRGGKTETKLYQIKTTMGAKDDYKIALADYNCHIENWKSAAIVLVSIPRRNMYVLGEPSRITGDMVYWSGDSVTWLSDEIHPGGSEIAKNLAGALQAKIEGIFDVLGAVIVSEKTIADLAAE